MQYGAIAKLLQYHRHIIFMGYESLARLSTAQLSKHIRARAKDSANVVFTVHVKQRMLERAVTHMEVLQCLRSGTMRRAPEANERMGTLECRMERLVLQRELACIVALCDEAPDLIIVTVFERST